ncbi:3'(2'),5'-bisphosphate nucleotidase [Hephaestia caeni]|uniref:3'(2'),5'-bisphosphate nucleotidase n=1 Tax=Hephaestia caeni TaxID=645617 RepID=A0A397P8S8_9SPHN|nr:3'(2'),5'-bisphosphate nucleotidase CysQ [Hephaestia caeni]RIA43535.1 3'(2'),5'-bisphosphate nucleotidase [Hephaestia caeni]
MTDAELAGELAAEAGNLLRRIRDEGIEDGKALGQRGDREANALILARLASERPDDAVLSEEAKDDRSRCAMSRVWVIDPLDGTREYGERRDDWAVHVGLAVDGRPSLGAVAIPDRGEVFVSDAVASLGILRERPIMVVSRTRAPQIAIKVAEAIGADLLPMGSAGAKAMAVVDSRADIYVHAGGQYEWDNCAPAAVALGAGLHASRLDGSPLVYNCENPLLPDIVICRAALATRVLAAIQAQVVADRP